MKRIWTVLLLAGSARGSDVTLWTPEHGVVDSAVMATAKDQVARMFGAIGVSLEWATARPVTPRGITIEVRLTTNTFPRKPRSLANSTPFNPKPVITVFYDRVISVTPQSNFRGKLLAHILVHEIGHVLMRMNIHSTEGVMKAHWTPADYIRMANEPLPFMPGDRDLIRNGSAANLKMRSDTLTVHDSEPASILQRTTF